MNLAKWAYELLGNSSLFRQSNLWQTANPLIYSALFPEKIPNKIEELVTDKVKASLQTSILSTALVANIATDLEAINTDGLSEALTQVTEVIDGTAIDYTVFFKE